MPSGNEDALLAIMQFPTPGKVNGGGGGKIKEKRRRQGEKIKGRS